jgi:hypothetical protein
MKDRHGYPGTPRWVILGGLALALLVGAAALMTSGGGHGPGRHFQSGSSEASFKDGDS